MKFTRRKLVETIRKKNQGWTTYQARKIARVSVRRVNQVWVQYKKTGRIPEIGKKIGRPRKPIEKWEIDMIKEDEQGVDQRIEEINMKLMSQ